MKKSLQHLIFGKSTFINGFIAVIILGLIVLGCTCNGKNFDFGKKKDTNASEGKKEDLPPTPEIKEITKSDASKGELPEDDELEAIVKETVLGFDNAIKTEDFTDFYKNSSEPFQDSISPRRMKNKFQKFIDGKADVSGVKDIKPEYTGAPKITKRGKTQFLEVKGEFATKPKPSRFDLKYIPEGKDWKLISFEIYTTIYTKRKR